MSSFVMLLAERVLPSTSINRTVGVIVWVGVIVFTLAFFVLSWTRLGNAKPLVKCLTLSVFAHVLLGVFFGFTTSTAATPVVMLFSRHARSSIVMWATERQQLIHHQPIPIAVFNSTVMQITFVVKFRWTQQTMHNGFVQTF